MAAAEAAAQTEAESWWIGTAHCPAGGDHRWSIYQGRRGSGRACLKCYEIRDSSNKPMWWCMSRAERDRIAGGGCPDGGAHALVWRNGTRGSGGIYDRCGFTKDANGNVLSRPMLLFVFGPPA